MTNYDPEQWEEFRETFASKRPLTNEEWARVGQGDNTVFQDVNWRHPTIHEAPPQPSKVGKWTRGFPGRPRDFPEWSRQAVLPRSVGDLSTTYLYWIDGDAETIIRDAHQSLIAQYEEALAGPGERPDICIERDLPPSLSGLMGWAPEVGWGNGTGTPEGRIFGWDFRPQSNEQKSDVGTVFMWACDDSDNVRMYLVPITLGGSVWDSHGPLAIGFDPDGHGLRSLDPEDPDPCLHPIQRALDIQAVMVAAVVAWTLLSQGGIIETKLMQQAPSKNKSARRRAQRHPDAAVELVTIRRSHTELVGAMQSAEAADAGGPDARNFRWIVSGHWRSQPHGPGGSLRRPTFIAPHLKGPEGAPVRRSRDRVFLL